MKIRWRGFELPYRVTVDPETRTNTYARFTAEPFERGFGHTIGNSLRRILLSSIEGSAVTTVKIQGVYHEFSTIPGIVEDVADIILNIKSLVVRSNSDTPRTIRIDRHERGVVTGADVITDEAVEVVNPEHHIATLTDDVPFVVEMTVERGRGYRPATERMQREQEPGVIPIDAIFSPVRRVEYHVEDTRVGQRVNYDRLSMQIWTNGVVTPEMALVEAAKILRKHLNPFIQMSEPGPEMPIDERPEVGVPTTATDEELERKLNMSLAELELSVRATNCLEEAGVTTVRDLVTRTKEELLKIRNFGETTLREVREKLKQLNLDVGMFAAAQQEGK